MVGKLNIPKNQYTKSITIPPVVSADTQVDIPITEPVSEVKTQPTSKTLPNDTKNTVNETTNKSAVSSTKDESLITEQKQDVEFPTIAFEDVYFGVPNEEYSSETIPLPSTGGSNNGDYTPISGVKPRQTTSYDTGVGGTPTDSQSIGVTTYSTKDHEGVNLREPSTNSGISIVVKGDNATITVSNNVESVTSTSEDALPTMKDIKNARSLEDLLLIEEQFAETLKYLEAKKLVFDIESKIK